MLRQACEIAWPAHAGSAVQLASSGWTAAEDVVLTSQRLLPLAQVGAFPTVLQGARATATALQRLE